MSSSPYPVFDVATMLIGISMHIPIAVIQYSNRRSIRMKRMKTIASYPIMGNNCSSSALITGLHHEKIPCDIGGGCVLIVGSPYFSSKHRNTRSLSSEKASLRLGSVFISRSVDHFRHQGTEHEYSARALWRCCTCISYVYGSVAR